MDSYDNGNQGSNYSGYTNYTNTDGIYNDKYDFSRTNPDDLNGDGIDDRIQPGYLHSSQLPFFQKHNKEDESYISTPSASNDTEETATKVLAISIFLGIVGVSLAIPGLVAFMVGFAAIAAGVVFYTEYQKSKIENQELEQSNPERPVYQPDIEPRNVTKSQTMEKDTSMELPLSQRRANKEMDRSQIDTTKPNKNEPAKVPPMSRTTKFNGMADRTI